MGLLFSKKVSKSSKDLLEDLERQITSKTRGRQRNQQYERSFVSYLLLLSFGVYLVGVAVLYLYFRPSNWVEWLGYLTPLILFPLVVYMIKKLLNLYFSHRKTQFDQELDTLYEDKRRVLNEVMEKETYKTAIELLQRYEPTHPSLQQSTPKETTPTSRRRSELRRRAVPTTPHPSTLHQSTPHPSTLHQSTPAMAPPPVPNPPVLPAPQPSPTTPLATTPARQHHAQVVTPRTDSGQPFIPPGMCLGAPPGPPTPCPILPRDRSQVDKVVEYLVGDGPNNRYALVCQKCHSHNGMALRDEFEYLSFRCAYCFELNPARKKKPSLKTPLHALQEKQVKPGPVQGKVKPGPVKGKNDREKEELDSY